MDTSDLKVLAHTARTTKEAGVALVLFSLILALSLFIPTKEPLAEMAISTQEESSAFENMHLSAKAVLVYDLSTKETLYEENADVQLPLASLTKLLTVEAAFRQMSGEELVTITRDDLAVLSPTRFAVGDSLSLRDLAILTLTASLNDGAVAITRAAAEEQDTTTHALLASAVSGIGLSTTYAINGSGLDISESVSGAYGSARDVALLAGALLETAPEVALGTTLPVVTARTTKGVVYEVANTNPMTDDVPGLLLSKTGFTDLAQGNLVLVFDAGIRHPIALVILHSTAEARFSDAKTLVAATLSHFAGTHSL